MMYKTLHRNLKIEQREPHKKLEVNPSKLVPTPLVAPVMLLLFEDPVICQGRGKKDKYGHNLISNLHE